MIKLVHKVLKGKIGFKSLLKKRTLTFISLKNTLWNFADDSYLHLSQ